MGGGKPRPHSIVVRPAARAEREAENRRVTMKAMGEVRRSRASLTICAAVS